MLSKNIIDFCTKKKKGTRENKRTFLLQMQDLHEKKSGTPWEVAVFNL